MRSRCVWVKKISALIGPLASSFLPRGRMPVPPSRMMRCGPHRTSRHDVLPPYLTYSDPGQDSDPRTPQKHTVKAAVVTLLTTPGVPGVGGRTLGRDDVRRAMTGSWAAGSSV